MLCQNQLLNLLDLTTEHFVGLDKVRHSLARVEHRGVVATSDCRADARERSLGVLLGKIHRYLTRLSDISCTLGRVETLKVEIEVSAHGLDDVVDGYLLLCQLDIDLQYILRQRCGNLATEERSVRHKR